MDEALVFDLADEVIEDFQIPPYIQVNTVQRAVKESMARIGSLAENVNFVEDLTARELVKNRTYYSLNHILDEFEKNYGPDIRAWQLGREVATDETDTGS